MSLAKARSTASYTTSSNRDRCTQSVVFEGVGELGGQAAEDRRLTYAWRLRHLLRYNSGIQNKRADVLRFLIIFFTLAAVCASVLFSYYAPCDANSSNDDMKINVLSRLNLILPLIITVLRGIFAALGPSSKALVLEVASIRIESEIYMYRTRTGAYSIRKATSTATAEPRKNGKGKEKEKHKDDSVVKTNNPRRAFSSALDSVLTDLSSSDVNKGGLINPPLSADPLQDINDRIEQQATAQDYYLSAIVSIRRKVQSSSYYESIPPEDYVNLESPMRSGERISPPAEARPTLAARPTFVQGMATRCRAPTNNRPRAYSPTGGPASRFDRYNPATIANDDYDPEENGFGRAIPSTVHRNPLRVSASSRGGGAASVNGREPARIETLTTVPSNNKKAQAEKGDSYGMVPMYDDGLSVLTADG